VDGKIIKARFMVAVLEMIEYLFTKLTIIYSKYMFKTYIYYKSMTLSVEYTSLFFLSLVLFLRLKSQKLFEIIIASASHKVPEVTAARKGAYVVAVVVIVEIGACD